MSSVIEVLKEAGRRCDTVHHFIAPGCSILPRVRNRLVSMALAEGCEWVVFVDDDIGFEARDFFKLFGYGVDVVGAGPAKRHARWDEKPAAVVKFGKRELTEIQTSTGRLWQVERLATAFLAIRAPVFDALKPVTEAYWSEGDPGKHETRTWFWFDLIREGRVRDEGEDYNFCRKWHSVGGECFLDPDIRLRHYDGNVCHDFNPADMQIKGDS